MEENLINSSYIIPIKGLSGGKHLFDFDIKGDLFASFGGSIVKDADLTACVTVEKGSGWMRLNAEIKGYVVVECDRCLDDLSIPIDIDAPLQIKFSKSFSDEDQSDDEYIIMDPSDGEFDMTQFLYDYICVSLPLQKVHKDGECNEKMIKKLNETNSLKSDSFDDGDKNLPFGGLKELLDRKN